MLTRIHAGSGVAIDINAKPQWSATASGQFGSCMLDIPRDSAAWDENIVYEDGRYLIEVMSRFGLWRGITDTEPVYSPAGVRVKADHISAWSGIRYMALPRRFQSAPAGLIARYAVRQALIGHDGIPVTLGRLVIAPPLVDLNLDGQSLADVLAELTSLTGQEWTIDDDLTFNWVMRQGTTHDFVITDDGRLFPDVQFDSGHTGEVIEVDDAGRRFVAYSGEAPRLWPSQETERV